MKRKEIYVAAGCFWGVQKYFDCVNGVINTEVGYVNGSTKEPSYAEVCFGGTGHAEALRVRFDEDVVQLKNILELYFHLVDPTLLNQQGNDRGIQYRTGIYYVDDIDKPIIEEVIRQEQNKYEDRIVTEVKKLENYYPAEEYHQKYLEKNPKGYCHVGKKELGFARNYNPDQANNKRTG